MYFKEKEDTNIDKEFSGNKQVNLDFNKLKPILFIVGGLVLLVIIAIILVNIFSKSSKYTLTIVGNETITINLGSDYVEPGYSAKDKKGNDITNEVKITSNIDTTKEGNYEILYSIGNVSKVRYIIIKKTNDQTIIRLINGKTMYLEVGEKYIEPGFQVYDNIDQNLNDKVTVTGKVDTSKPGVYEITYSVVNSRNITTTVKRTITVVEKGQNLKNKI